MKISKKIIISGISLALVLTIGLYNIRALKDSFITSPLAEIYVKYLRDGVDIDADHLVAKMHNGMSIIVNKYDRCVCWFIRIVGYWDSSETKALGNIIKKDFNVVEVGSNFGVHTLYMADLVGEHGKVYAFEANPNVSKYLKQSVSLNKLEDRVQVFEMAASNQNYDGFMVYGVKNIGGGYILADTAETRDQCKTENCTPIQVKILDEVLKDKKIDVLKMDAEGSEFWVLEGAKTLLANPKLTLIMEWNTSHLRRNGVDVNNFIQLLQNEKFHVWSIGRKGKLTPVTYANLATDAVYDLVLSRNSAEF